jgi:ATP-binding protein involved in chromosome partitioning
MFDVTEEKPGLAKIEGKRAMIPVESYDVKIMSIGFFARAEQSIAWRGPMAAKALQQMIYETAWGELDLLIIDLPPGTGDVHLSIISQIPIDGAIIVTTPQRVAIADVRKGIHLFQMESVQIPVWGIIENMAYFTPPPHPEEKYYLFGQEGGKRLSELTNIPFLGDLPIHQDIREAGDVGRPAVLQQNPQLRNAYGRIFEKLKNHFK